MSITVKSQSELDKNPLIATKRYTLNSELVLNTYFFNKVIREEF